MYNLLNNIRIFKNIVTYSFSVVSVLVGTYVNKSVSPFTLLETRGM